MSELVIYAQRGATAVLTFNRPNKANALSSELLDELRQHLQRIEDDDSVRGVVLTGNDHAFSAGADLGGALQAQSPRATERLLSRFTEVNRCLETMSKPAIAAINGYCLTGGLELALACDVRVAGHKSRFGITSARIGSVAGAGGTQRLPRLVGEQWAKHMMFSARFIDAETALRIGLVLEVMEPDQVLARAIELSDQYAEQAPLSVWYTKKAVNTGMQMNLHDALTFERVLTTVLWTTEDRIEGMTAFLEKRKAQFKGR
ncbi:MAG: enoyl-CoA hydratase/isomerase family protein [Gammaproteobacteria bacterium]|nr:enoyl-CoA hydratase/isomerase family protein [Gammaproteobacteria bacterium]